MTGQPSGEKFNYEEKSSPELDELVRNSTHPEMQNLDPNEEFIAVVFGRLNASLTKTLRARIDNLKKSPPGMHQDMENEIDQENNQGLGTST